jgi:hypothetical protein
MTPFRTDWTVSGFVLQFTEKSADISACCARIKSHSFLTVALDLKAHMVRLDLTINLEYQVLQPTEFVFKFHAVETPRQKVGLKHLIIPPNTPFTIES